MVEDYAQAEREGRVVSRREGLMDFMDYVGNDVLLGHNVNYDYNILKNNLKRYCKGFYDEFEATALDTLKLAHLICPRLRKYKLEYLIERLDLEGTNSHNAKDDIMATFELAKYCRSKSDNLLQGQMQFYQNAKVLKVIDELHRGYKYCYDLTKGRLYLQHSAEDEYAIVSEMKELSTLLSQLCEFKIVDSFDLIIAYLNEDVISKDEPNALKSHFANHLMDMSTYREADLCASSNFKEKLFVSTVHKAKGLEFENVVVMRAVKDRYPHFAHIRPDRQEEDKRLFYVAISRAMKRLIVSGSSSTGFTPFLKSIIDRFTIRFILYNRYLVEIGSDEMRITDQGRLVRKYKNLSKVYSPSDIRDQRALQNILRYKSNSLDLPENTDRLLSKYGVYPS
jgi:DNA helicase-2/ATP-dependent DNA helicase PcrA